VMASRSADITWVERELFPGQSTFAGLVGRPFVFDVDDAIWLSTPGSPLAIERIVSRAAKVFAGNGFIADWMSQHAADVTVVPTAIDTDRFLPSPADDRPFTLGWTGTSANFRYLELIEEPLAAYLRARPARLVVVADRPPRLAALPPEKWTFVPWTAESETRCLASVDVGLMPLDDSDWARGKCGSKLLQYMATGIASIASPVGFSAELLAASDIGIGAATPDEWYSACHTLEGDEGLRRHMGACARRLAEDRYSVTTVGAAIAGEFNALR
jgi:glycosyltransferase involved in cell wall biosynthesis